ncbi:MAG: hypothetical protein A2928_03200 [Candidatus Taylorbacteria bacterium RIFCSPLOWO2_01_FULL_45_15b]|uniref:N-acetyltransferase domain-containing protein n=1 Tax=Candidatus Taylorbacteria bacterium RIFCSPLOWO2_01_FULL_45_15b TaxID=1802319 RepID=A0A1G2NDV3_9BACT|nr:MAG: hypothetical protein A2928_03200 [Candidatus Taylorbacteria bacterium RIFCSPLOWO2_01_FULL_45_15b]
MSEIRHIVFRCGPRVYLRPMTKKDLPNITRWINDPEVTQYLLTVYPLRFEDEEKWFESLGERKGKDSVFAIVLKHDHKMIGVMGLHSIDNLHGIAETGSFIGEKRYWGKGYGSEAKMLVLEYAFNAVNLRKVNSSVHAFNIRSKKSLEKCGYRVEGRRVKQYYKNGEYVDSILLAVFKEDFLPLWKKFEKSSKKKA